MNYWLRPIIIHALCRKGVYSSRLSHFLYSGSFPFPALRLGRFLIEWSWIAFCAFSIERLIDPEGGGAFSTPYASAGCISTRPV